ncbi:MAG: helix-turn-helix transcriptional regulator [Candidatus Lokiarchaeota archaeon]|nr:helix-turn-helix transcriptional regulator [Candidatus Lokiarchaeota archaeon]
MSLEKSRRLKRKDEKDKEIKHLNWLQQRILELLWEQRGLYGQEIADILSYKHVDEEKIRSGQLYPALRRLEKVGLVKSEEKKIENIKHVIYSITKLGEIEIQKQFAIFFHLMEVSIGKKLTQILENLNQNLDFSDKLCVDLSNRLLDPVTLKLAEFVKPDGRYIIRKDSYFDADLSELLKKRIITFNHQHVISVKDRDKITSRNVDIAIAVFTLHEDDSNWILPKMKEILRNDGYGVIIDLVGLEDHIIEKIVCENLSNHQRIGIDVEEMKEQLSRHGFNIINETTINGIITLIFQN